MNAVCCFIVRCIDTVGWALASESSEMRSLVSFGTSINWSNSGKKMLHGNMRRDQKVLQLDYKKYWQ